ncbi:MAG: hypothetical protein DMF77_15175 [Acidobacteria bacterium]|nr:MAG: hypothetical protein DMF77_15175 [Acidobacteriota bacterium]
MSAPLFAVHHDVRRLDRLRASRQERALGEDDAFPREDHGIAGRSFDGTSARVRRVGERLHDARLQREIAADARELEAGPFRTRRADIG